MDRRILAGWIAEAEDKPESAIELMRSAGELEATAEKHPVTPGALYPPYESLGDLLLAQNRPGEALIVVLLDHTHASTAHFCGNVLQFGKAVPHMQNGFLIMHMHTCLVRELGYDRSIDIRQSQGGVLS